MKRQHDLRARLRSLSALREAVSAMKSLSAHHLRDARASLGAVVAYQQGVERLAADVGVALPAGDGAAGMVVLGSELGLCGAYNGRLAQAALEARYRLGPGPTYVLGQRAAGALRRQGLAPTRVYRAPTVVGAVTEALVTVIETLLPAYLELRMATLVVVSTPFIGVGAGRPTVAPLLPWIAPTGLRFKLRYDDSQRVAAVAARELLYITLYRQLVDALASEHGARLLATQDAEQWLTGRTDLLRRRLAKVRREASTQEVIEIATGARVRDAGGERPPR